MKVVIDMNLGLDWVLLLESAGSSAVHWSSIGHQDEADVEIMRWARDSGHVVLTADLDFGMHLVRSGDDAPSIVQLRTGDTLPSAVGRLVLTALDQASAAIEAGAIVTIDDERIRVRRLRAS